MEVVAQLKKGRRARLKQQPTRISWYKAPEAIIDIVSGILMPSYLGRLGAQLCLRCSAQVRPINLYAAPELRTLKSCPSRQTDV